MLSRSVFALAAVLLVAAAAASGVLAKQPPASAPPATLTGEVLQSSTFAVTCTDNGGGVPGLTFGGSGVATGPYPGTFTEQGTVQGDTLNATFTIDSVNGLVTGTKTRPVAGTFLPCSQIAGLGFGQTPYAATIQPPAGQSYSDQGLSVIQLAVSGGALPPFDNTGYFQETFTSTQTETTPTCERYKEHPTHPEKSRCKDKD